MKICDYLTTDSIIYNLEKTTKDEVINEVLSLFENDERINDFDKFKQSVFDREKIMSTGVGKGFAIPHSKTNSVSSVVAAFAKTKTPIDFKSLDGEPVSFIFLLVGQENAVGMHIKLLSRVSRMMNSESFRDALTNASSVEDVLTTFREEENKFV